MTLNAAPTQLVEELLDKFAVPIKVHVLDSVLDARLPSSLDPVCGFIAKGVTNKGEIYLFRDALLRDILYTLFHMIVTASYRY